ncbi:hypothetical protein FACS189445_6080 [Spirochaetia bacterium]|nr:hypothetical protein FACS189445_6080 [Spirochaetia bacterium]
MHKYFSVRCKCGHVGKGNFIPLEYPIYAATAKDAAAIARNKGGVKHHHRDAIISVEEIAQEQYQLLRRAQSADPYWKGARMNIYNLTERIQKEPTPTVRHNRFNRMVSIQVRQKKTALSEREIYNDIIREYGLGNV